MTTMPATASTTRLDLASFWWANGLPFHRCVDGDPWALFEFLDPDGRAAGLAAAFRDARRRLLYAVRVAGLTPGGVVTLAELDHPRQGLRRDLRAAALAEFRTAAH